MTHCFAVRGFRLNDTGKRLQWEARDGLIGKHQAELGDLHQNAFEYVFTDDFCRSRPNQYRRGYYAIECRRSAIMGHF